MSSCHISFLKSSFQMVLIELETSSTLHERNHPNLCLGAGKFLLGDVLLGDSMIQASVFGGSIAVNPHRWRIWKKLEKTHVEWTSDAAALTRS